MSPDKSKHTVNDSDNLVGVFSKFSVCRRCRLNVESTWLTDSGVASGVNRNRMVKNSKERTIPRIIVVVGVLALSFDLSRRFLNVFLIPRWRLAVVPCEWISWGWWPTKPG